MAAIKKNRIYSSLWESCDNLRGGLDASEYKDYILTLLFMKYITDKYLNKGKYEDIKVFDKEHDPETDPEKKVGCSYNDFINLKNNKNIGETMDKIIARLVENNTTLQGVINIYFNDEKKIGKGDAQVEKLTNLVSIFQREEFDFKSNKSSGDDIIGDAYEYLMRKFAVDSGKSKGQFYTPAEVSRILAKLLDISECSIDNPTIYDPACGSGSLLIKALDEVPDRLKNNVAGYGQEVNPTTAGLAKMNAIIHNQATMQVYSGNTFSEPHFFDDNDNEQLKTFDYIVANPPFSLKKWSHGFKAFGRFDGYGDVPPDSNGDYAWLLHIIKSLKNTGKAAVILPLGVLFRGGREGTIRKNIVDKGFIKGIIALPANLFYGTGIPACIIVLDKNNADERNTIFMIDASNGFIKDGNKNRLREQDIYKIVKTFKENIEERYYSKIVTKEDIIKNEYNLNISRYIESGEKEDIQNIYAHIHGGIPKNDIDCLSQFSEIFPNIKRELYSEKDDLFYNLNIQTDEIQDYILNHNDFKRYGNSIKAIYKGWIKESIYDLINLTENINVNSLIHKLSYNIFDKFKDVGLINNYDVYDILLNYWNEVMHDDISIITANSELYNNAKEIEIEYSTTEKKQKDGTTKKEEKEKSWDGYLIPKDMIIKYRFRSKLKEIDNTNAEMNIIQNKLQEIIDNIEEDSSLFELIENDKIKIDDVQNKMKEIEEECSNEEITALKDMQDIFENIKTKKKYNQYIGNNPLCKSALNENNSVTKASIEKAIKCAQHKCASIGEDKEEYEQLKEIETLLLKISELKSKIKSIENNIDKSSREYYLQLSDKKIKYFLLYKWFFSIYNSIDELYKYRCYEVVLRIVELAERYDTTLPELINEVDKYEQIVKNNLKSLGYEW